MFSSAKETQCFFRVGVFFFPAEATRMCGRVWMSENFIFQLISLLEEARAAHLTCSGSRCQHGLRGHTQIHIHPVSASPSNQTPRVKLGHIHDQSTPAKERAVSFPPPAREHAPLHQGKQILSFLREHAQPCLRPLCPCPPFPPRGAVPFLRSGPAAAAGRAPHVEGKQAPAAERR